MAKKTLKKGVFITFEGIEGCGKSTHSKVIYNFLRNKGFNCVYIREPGGTRIGEEIRKVLLNPRNKEMSEKTELFLFEANRAQISKELIKPSLVAGKIVISDRFSDSTTAYQGYAGKLNIEFIERISSFASSGIKPDLTIILDIAPKTGLRKVSKLRIKDRMERKKLSYHNSVRQGYKELAKKYKKRIKLIKVRNNIEKTQDLIRKEVLKVISRLTG